MSEYPLRLGEVLPAPVAGRCAVCGERYSVGTPITVIPGLKGWVTAALCYEEDDDRA